MQKNYVSMLLIFTLFVSQGLILDEVKHTNLSTDNRRIKEQKLACVHANVEGKNSSVYHRSNYGWITKARHVFINVPPSGDVPKVWQDALFDATLDWNRLGVRIQLHIVNKETVPTGLLDKTVTVHYFDFVNTNRVYIEDPANAMAAADYPYNGYPGKNLYINSAWNPENKKAIILHELGHTVGFGHTGESSDDDSPFFTSQDCQNQDAVSSIFHAYILPEITTFSTCDKQAVRMAYGFVR